MANLQAGILLRHIRKLATAESIGHLGDGQLLERFTTQRDEAAFAVLIERHGPMVLGVCRRVLHHQHDAEDAFQATFLTLARKAGSIRQQEALSGWLYRVAYHTAAKARARAAKQSLREQGSSPMQPADPLAEVTWREVRTVLDEELHQMADKFAAPLVLCYLQGKTQDQAAEALGWTKSTLRRRLEQGRQYLRRRLARRGLTLSAALAATLISQVATPAAVPAFLLAVTVRVSLAAAAKGLAAGLVPAEVASLCSGAWQPVLSAKLKIVALVVAIGMLGLAAGSFTFQARAQRQAEEASVARPESVKGVLATARPSRTQGVPHSGQKGRGEELVKKPPVHQRKPAMAGPHRPVAKGKGRSQDKGKVESEIAVTGQVIDPAGKTVPGALAAVVAWSHQTPQTGQVMSRPAVWGQGKADAKGRFRFSVRRPQPATYYRERFYQLAVVAGHKGHGLGWHFFTFDAVKTEVKVRLQAEQFVRGRLLDLQGQPVAAARLEVVQVGAKAPSYERFSGGAGDESINVYAGVYPIKQGETIRQWEGEIRFFEAPQRLPAWPEPLTTDAQGRFTLRGVGRNQALGLHVRAKDRVAFQKLEFAPRKEERPAEVSFSLGAARLVVGKVTDARTGKPLANARIHIDMGGAFAPPWPLPADWKGRRGLFGQGFSPSSLGMHEVPGVDGQTDAQGNFRLNPYLGNRFIVTFSAPPGQPYLGFKKTLRWPTGAAQQTVNAALTPGVLVRGTVSEEGSGRAVAQARVDFWSKDIPMPKGLFDLPPDGVLYPTPQKTDAGGGFELVVPAGPCHILVNGPGPNYVLKKIATKEVLVKQPDLLDWQLSGVRPGKKQSYYPDEWTALNFKVGARPGPLKLVLRRAPIIKGRLVGPDGKPVVTARLFQGQAPFAELSNGSFGQRYEVRAGRFDLPLRNLETPLCVAILDSEKKLGARVEFGPKQAGAGPVTVRLQPCVSATARFVDGKGKPLAGYRPLLWLSLPAKPYSTTKELEGLTGSLHYNYDAVWLGYDARKEYGSGPKTDAKGNVTFPLLIRGATYRLTLFDGVEKEFKVEAEKPANLGDIAVKSPEKTKGLPNF
jgi:RNA polymerase sigma factor (sigma-70 family)